MTTACRCFCESRWITSERLHPRGAPPSWW
jgi:hypothetical protein